MRRNNTKQCNTKGKPRQKRGKGKPKEVEVNVDRKDINDADLKRSSDNDVSWYTKNAQLAIDAASLPYGFMLGTQLPATGSAVLDNSAETPPAVGPKKTAIPGICAINFIPTVGYSDGPTSAVNLAARQQFAFLRYANSGASNYYEAADIMMYYMVIDSANIILSMMKRAYGTIKAFSLTNRYYAESIVRMQGFDFQLLSANLADFRMLINEYIYKLQSFAIPADMAIFDRHEWMASGLYLDGQTSKAQTYLFVPDAYYTFEEGSEPGPNYVKAHLIASETATIDGGIGKSPLLGLSRLQTILNNIIESIMGSQSILIMSGDILKAYGRENLRTYSPIPEDYTVLPEYSMEVLTQIENLTQSIPYSSFDVSAFDIKQNVTGVGAGIIVTPRMSTASTDSHPMNFGEACMPLFAQGERLLNMHMEQPTVADNLVATRLMHSVKSTNWKWTGATGKFSCDLMIYDFGTEIVDRVTIGVLLPELLSGVPNMSLRTFPVSHFITFDGPLGDVTGVMYSADALKAITMLQQFDWHMSAFQCTVAWNTYFATDTSTPESLKLTSMYDTRDIDNFTFVDEAIIRRINEVAVLSLFDSPRIAQMTAQSYKK